MSLKTEMQTLTRAQLMHTPFETGAILVNASQNSIVYNGTALELQPKVLELLVLLCAAQGDTLSKQTLTDALWPNTVVGPDSLANTMARLRKALHEDAQNPTFIKTVQRKGYRWLQQVTLIKEDSNKRRYPKYLMMAASLAIAVLLFFVLQPKQPEPLPFPDLYIEKLAGGGYEIQVGIDGELTEQKKAEMLQQLKRITGEENSGMEFTVDPVKPGCGSIKNREKNQAECEKQQANKTKAPNNKP